MSVDETVTTVSLCTQHLCKEHFNSTIHSAEKSGANQEGKEKIK